MRNGNYMITVREMFEVILNLCEKYGIEKVKTTMDSIFDAVKMLDEFKERHGEE